MQVRGIESRSICAFGTEPNTIVVLSADGSFMIAKFDEPGECERISYAKFIRDDTANSDDADPTNDMMIGNTPLGYTGGSNTVSAASATATTVTTRAQPNTSDSVPLDESVTAATGGNGSSSTSANDVSMNNNNNNNSIEQQQQHRSNSGDDTANTTHSNVNTNGIGKSDMPPAPPSTIVSADLNMSSKIDSAINGSDNGSSAADRHEVLS
jgi:hypothetical protein